MHKWTLCMVIKQDKILLKLAVRGISKGRWTGLGGSIEPGETPEDGIVREVYEESGLRVVRMKKAGRIWFYRGSRKSPIGLGHLFVVNGFSGKVKSTEEGRVKWFSKKDTPLDKMWDDDKYWLPMLLKGQGADMEFIYDREMAKVKEYRISKIRKISDSKTIRPRS